MLEITVKTIDGQNRSYSIPDNYTIRQFKEKISASLNISVDRQRLIFQGRELKDDKLLKDFDVNGKTIHLVQRTPPSLLFQTNSSTNNRLGTTNLIENSHAEEPNILLGGMSFNTPTVNRNLNSEVNDFQTVFQQIIGGLTGSLQNNQFNNHLRNLGVDIHIDLGNMSQVLNDQDIRNRIRSIRRLLVMVENRLNRIREIQSGAPLNDLENSNASNLSNLNSFNNYASANNQTLNDESTNMRIEILADIINSVMDAYQRFQPYLQDYYRLIINDTVEPESENIENRRQRFCNNVNDMMHLIGHLFHNLSDLHVNLRDIPPRNIRTMVPFQTAIISTTPLETNIQIPITMTVTPTTVTNTSSSNSVSSQSTQIRNEFNNLNANNDMNRNSSQNSSFSLGQPFNYFQCTPNTITLNQLSAQVIQDDILRTNDLITDQTNDSSSSCSVSNSRDDKATTTNSKLSSENSTSHNNLERTTTPSSPNLHNTASGSLCNNNAATITTNSTSATTIATTTNTTTTTTTNNNNNNNYNNNFIRSTRNNLQHTNITADPYLSCNSVHFFNSLVNNIQSNSGVAGGFNISPSYQRIRVSNNVTQRRRHPAGNQNITNFNENNFANSQLRTNESNNHMQVNESNHNPINTSNLDNSSRIAHTIDINNDASSTDDTSSLYLPSNVSHQRQYINFSLSSFISNLIKLFNQYSFTNHNLNNTVEKLREIYSVINSDDPSNEILRKPFSDLVNELAGKQEPNDPSNILRDMFNIIFSQMSLGDVINLLMNRGLGEVLNKLKAPLKNYIQNKILNNKLFNQDNEINLINIFYDEILRRLGINLNDFEVSEPNIDFTLSVEKLLKFHFKKLLLQIFNTDEENWGIHFYQLLNDFGNNAIALCRVCLKDPDTTIINFIIRQIEKLNIISNSSQSLKDSLQLYLFSQFKELVSSIHANTDTVQKFIIKNKMSFQKYHESKKLSPLNNSQNSISSSVQVRENSEKNKTSCASNAITVNEAVNWRTVLPTEWLSTISTDVCYQQRNIERKTLSDAYISGMPPKRRKVVKKQNVFMETLLKTVMRRTLSQITARDNLSHEAIMDISMKENALVNEFGKQVDKRMIDRLEHDIDFISIIRYDYPILEDSDKNSFNKRIQSSDKIGRFHFTKKRMR